MFWKKKQPEKPKETKIILGMVLLNDLEFDQRKFVEDFSTSYGHSFEEPASDSSSFVFSIESEMVAIGLISAPVPAGDIESTAEYAYNWPSAKEDTKDHKAHLIVSLMKGTNDPLSRFRTFTKVICSLLRTTNAVGLYQGNQSLLIPKRDDLSEAGMMSDDYLPLDLWIYFGIRVSDKGNSGYTYGLAEFGKTEIEINESTQDLEDIRGYLFNIAHYLLAYDVSFRDGETVGLSEDEKISLLLSKGLFVEGKTFKLIF